MYHCNPKSSHLHLKTEIVHNPYPFAIKTEIAHNIFNMYQIPKSGNGVVHNRHAFLNKNETEIAHNLSPERNTHGNGTCNM